MDVFWDTVAALAVAASAFNTTPQLIKSYRTKRTEDISFWMLGIIMLGNVMWIAHGLHRSDAALIVANGILFATTVAIALLKVRYDRIVSHPKSQL